ncbi:MAG: DUF1302 family protein [Myxococcota bacterium]
MRQVRHSGAAVGGAAVVLLAVLAGPATALEFWDERIEAHGFYETRMAFGMEDWTPSNGVDMYSWLHVLNVEVEAEIAPDGWGPFDLVSAFTRVEVKYDCVWNHACGLLDNVNVFGNRPKELPHRVMNARRQGGSPAFEMFDRRGYWYGDRQTLDSGLFFDRKTGTRRARPFPLSFTAGDLFVASPGPDEVWGDMADIRDGDPFSGLPGDDDAGLYLFERAHSCKTGTYARKDSSPRGHQSREVLWSIDGCHMSPNGYLRRVANPFRDFASFGAGGDVNPVLLAVGDADGIPDQTALPLRPGAENPAAKKPTGRKWESQGLFVPNAKLRKELQRGSFDSFDQNFSLNELQWNRGANQQEWKELRELYLDLEFFDSRLWVRLGKQTIVWGKTELFRNQDQWNPVDIAIGPLSSLEEARIALWALRGVWSFYEVGPLSDVRAELVVLYDEFEPADVGRCGEPYVPRLACTKSFGLFVHGQTGNGIAGEIRPDDPWNSAKGIEIGGRIEFRWERFSFAVTEYWGYNDSAYQSLLFQYDRNVDPVTGRPRHTETRGPCTTGDPTIEPDCLAPGHPLGDVVEIHSINQSIFAWVCAGTVGVAPSIDPAACAFTLFNSTESVSGLGTQASLVFSSILADSSLGRQRWPAITGDLVGGPKVQLALNDAFGPPGTNTLDIAADGRITPLVRLVNNNAPGNETNLDGVPGGLDRVLAPEQEAFFGCGPFYQTDCDNDGIDLANAAADVLLQSFPWFEGTFFNPNWDASDPTLPQPGTVDAAFNDGPGGGVDAPFSKPGELETGPAGSRFENGLAFVLPGAHYDPVAFTEVLANAGANGIDVDQWVLDNLAGYDISQDGSVCPGGDFARCRRHPFTGQVFSSEMAVASWNLLMLVTAFNAEDDPASRAVLDRNNPLALGRCSFRQPQFCAFVSGLANQARISSSNIRAGGNRRFGRRQFVWSSIGDLTLQYQKRNTLGFSMDFAEDRTKSSWGVEFTWVDDSLTADASKADGLSDVDEYNLTLSMDRPTFINFLNANRTFLLNTQLFMSYVGDYSHRMSREGPWTFLWLINASTGYYQDRFLVSTVLVHDFQSNSGAILPTVQYRITENFSVTVGASVFYGDYSRRKMGINQFSAFDEDNLSDNVYVENGVSPVSDLDGFFTRIRYTF